MTITALPALNQTVSTFRDDADLYFNTELPQFSIDLDNGWSEMNASTILAVQEAQFTANQVTLATQQAQAAALSAGSVGAIAWVSGTTYATGVSRYSPLDSQVYRRIIAGAGTTDPSLDKVNWSVVNSLPNQNIVLPTNNLPQIRPSLSLDFTNAQTVDPRVTFTRASTATRTNNKGLIEVVPVGIPRIDYDPISLACKGLLVEEARTNILTYSEDFKNGTWTVTSAIVLPNTITSPSGANNASRLSTLIAGVANTGLIDQGVTSVTVSTVYTFSVYIKAGTSPISTLNFYRSSPFSQTLLTITWSTFSAVASGTDLISSSFVAVGNGWYRASLTMNSGTSTGMVSRIYVRDQGTSNVVNEYCYIWGAQLEAGAFPTTYQPSTETFTGRTSIGTYYGSNGLLQTALSGVARLNYNPMNLTVQPKLLLEAAATNLLVYSTDIAGTSWSNVTTVYSVATSSVVDLAGTLTAKRFTKTAVADSVFARQNVTISSGVTYVASVWCYVPTQAGISSFGFNFDLNDIESSAVTTSTVFDQWIRLSAVRTTTGARSAIDFAMVVNGTSPAPTGFIFHAFGAQLEVGAFPTSYIPTTVSSVSRSADTSTSTSNPRLADVATMTGVNFSSWYRQDEGTFVVGFRSLSPTTLGFERVFSADDSTNNNIITLLKQNGSGAYYSTINASNIVQAIFSTPTIQVNTLNAVSLTYKTNSFGQSSNGTLALSDTSGSVPTVTRFGFNDPANGVQGGHYIQYLTYYPEGLSGVELQALSRQ